jgi:type I restriction enzyme S subunit
VKNWRTGTLADVCHFENGDRGKNYPGKSAILDKGVPFVNAGDLNDGALRRGPLSYISAEHFRKLSNGKFKKGDILFCLRGSLGKFAVIEDDISGAIASSLIIIRPKDSISRSYLKSYLGSKICEEQIDLYRNGAAQPNLAASSLKKFSIPLPPLEEQQRIAAILSKADVLRRKREHAIDLLHSIEKSIFVEMFEKQKGLEVHSVPLREICQKITDGTHQSPKWADSGVPFLFVSNIRGQQISFETKNFVSESEYEKLTKYSPIESGDVLYTAVGSYGHAAVVPPGRKFVFQRHIAQLKPKLGRVNSNYLSVALEMPDARRQADRYAKGVAQKTVTLASLKEMTIPLPPLEAQNEFAAKAAVIYRQAKLSAQHLHQSDVFLASLQFRAFSGQL